MGRAFSIVLCASTSLLIMSVPNRVSAQGNFIGPAILPPAPGALAGGNPLQGLGRSDDPGVSREKQYGFPTYNSSGFNADGMQDFPAPTFYSEGYASYPHSDAANTNTSTSSTNTNTNGGSPGNFPGGFIPTSMLDSPSLPSANSQSTSAAAASVLNSAGQNFAPGFAGQAGFGAPGSGGDNLNSGNSGAGLSTNGYNNSSNVDVNTNSNSNYNYNTAAPTQVPVTPSAPSAFTLPPSTPVQLPGSAGNLNQVSGTNAAQGAQMPLLTAPGATSQTGSAGAGASLAPQDSRRASNETRSGSIFDTRSAKTTNLNQPNQPGQPGQLDKMMLDVGTDEAPKGFAFVPPPPPTAYGGGSFGANANAKVNAGPLTSAIDLIKVGRFPDALVSINNVLATDGTNANAHYLKAVALVFSRRFNDARSEYLATLRYSHSAELNARVHVGLNKLAH